MALVVNWVQHLDSMHSIYVFNSDQCLVIVACIFWEPPRYKVIESRAGLFTLEALRLTNASGREINLVTEILFQCPATLDVPCFNIRSTQTPPPPPHIPTTPISVRNYVTCKTSSQRRHSCEPPFHFLRRTWKTTADVKLNYANLNASSHTRNRFLFRLIYRMLDMGFKERSVLFSGTRRK